MKVVFVAAILLQVLWFGVPMADVNPQPGVGVDAMFQPLTQTLWGYVTYAYRALAVAMVAALLLR